MYKSAYKPLVQALISALSNGRTGVFFGGTAGYPRVEVHSVIENPPLDKGGAVRVVNATVESMSVTSPEEAATMNTDNLAKLGSFTYTGTEFRVIGLLPSQLQELTENSDPQKILHRVLQVIDIYVQQIQ